MLFITDIEAMVTSKQIPDTVEARLGAAQVINPKIKGNPDLKEQSFYTDYEFQVWAESVREYSRVGWPFSETRFREMLQDGVRAGYQKMVEDGDISKWDNATKSNGGDIPDFGYSFMKR